MARYYLQNALPAITPTQKGAWNDSSQSVRSLLSTSKSGTLEEKALGIGSTSANYKQQLVRGITGALASDCTVTLSDYCIGLRENPADTDAYTFIYAYVTQGSSTTSVRGVLVDNWTGSNEWGVTQGSRGLAETPTNSSVVASAGDYIVVEIGASGSAENTGYSVKMTIGGTDATDLTNGGDERLYTGWINLNLDTATTSTSRTTTSSSTSRTTTSSSTSTSRTTTSSSTSFTTSTTTTLTPGQLVYDNFESGSFSAGWTWGQATDGGDLSITTGAALHGSKGMSLLIDDTTAINTVWNGSDQTTFRFRFYIDPNSISIQDTKYFDLVECFNNAWGQTLFMALGYKAATGYYINIVDASDGAWSAYGEVNITNAPHCVEVNWKASTAPGANNGIVQLIIDGVLVYSNTSVDNDTESIGIFIFGAQGFSAGTFSGTFYLDDFVANNSGTEIGLLDIPTTSTSITTTSSSTSTSRTTTSSSTSVTTTSRTTSTSRTTTSSSTSTSRTTTSSSTSTSLTTTSSSTSISTTTTSTSQTTSTSTTSTSSSTSTSRTTTSSSTSSSTTTTSTSTSSTTTSSSTSSSTTVSTSTTTTLPYQAGDIILEWETGITTSTSLTTTSTSSSTSTTTTSTSTSTTTTSTSSSTSSTTTSSSTSTTISTTTTSTSSSTSITTTSTSSSSSTSTTSTSTSKTTSTSRTTTSRTTSTSLTTTSTSSSTSTTSSTSITSTSSSTSLTTSTTMTYPFHFEVDRWIKQSGSNMHGSRHPRGEVDRIF